MRYMALIYGEEAGWDALSDGERSAVYARHGEVAQEMRQAGVMVGGAELASTSDATTVRVRDGDVLVTDGPYAEVKEVLGGYYLLECESLEEALDWAARIPGADEGAIEVRPLHAEPEEEL